MVQCIALALLLCGAIGAQGQELAAQIETLKSGDAGARERAVEILSRNGAKAIPALASLLYGSNPTAHQGAMVSLQRLTAEVARPGADKTTRQAVAEALIQQAKSGKDLSPAGRSALLEFASLVAEKEQVPALVSLFAEKELREAARYALTRIPGAEASKALAGMLTKADPEFQVALLVSLAERADATTAPAVQALLKTSKNASVRLAAISALGRIPRADSSWQLWEIARGSEAAERNAARNAYLMLAERLAAKNDAKTAREMFQKVYTDSLNTKERCAALAGLGKVSDATTLSVLVDALLDKEPQARAVAADALAASRAPAVTTQLIASYAQAMPESRALILDVLAQRPEPVAIQKLMEAAEDRNSVVREAAFRALAERKSLSPEQMLPLYHRALTGTNSDEERRVILAALERYANPASLPFLRGAMGRETVRDRALQAMLPIASKIAQSGKKDEAIALYKEVVEQSRDTRLIREAAGKLRGLGIALDLASKQGYIGNWWVLGPIPGRDKWKTEDITTVDTPLSLDKTITHNGATLRWKYVALDDPSGMLDFKQAVANQDNAAAYAFAEVTSRIEQEVLFKIGSDDDVVCWVNEQKVHQFLGDRGWSADQDVVPVRLVPGVNRILVKVLNAGGGWAVSLRITDKNNLPLQLAQRKPEQPATEQIVTTPSGLQYVDLVVGKGPAVKLGDNVSVHYVGTLLNGTKFDSSRDRGEPFLFTLGASQVIRGWEEGIATMRVGGKRRLIIPPALAYGDKAVGAIPANSTLVFEVEVLNVQ
jgi:peptidylprolyl isomerase